MQQVGVALIALIALWCVVNVLATWFVSWLYRDDGGLPMNWRCLWPPTYHRWLTRTGQWP